MLVSYPVYALNTLIKCQNLFLSSASLTLPLTASFSQSPVSPITILDGQDFNDSLWVDVKALKTWVDGKYLAFKFEYAAPIPSYTEAYRWGNVTFLTGKEEYTLMWIAIGHQALSSLLLGGETLRGKVYFKVEDGSVSLFIPLKTLRLRSGSIYVKKVIAGGGYLIRPGDLSLMCGGKGLAPKLGDEWRRAYVRLSQRDSSTSYTSTLTFEELNNVSLCNFKEMPYLLIYLKDLLPEFRVPLSRVVVKVMNIDDNALKVKLYMDGRLLGSSSIGKNSTKIMGVYIVSQGPHEFTIEWRDFDREFRRSSMITIENSTFNVLLKTQLYTKRPVGCGCKRG